MKIGKVTTICKCSYCDSDEHTIYECPEDQELSKIFNSAEEPNFNGFSKKILKKMAVLAGAKKRWRYWQGQK
jgi:hypothetical protein